MINKIVTKNTSSISFEKRKWRLLYFHTLIGLFGLQCCSGQDNCSLIGEWTIKQGRLTEKYEGTAPYQASRVQFYKDSIELASGFFYNTMGLNDDYPRGRYPFVYYGNKEIYKRTENTLNIFSKPYNQWSEFEIQCDEKNQIRLINTTNSDTVLLEKFSVSPVNVTCKIKSIKVHIYKGTLDQFNVGYKTTFLQNDLMIYDEQDSITENFKQKSFKLRKGTFEEICRGFRYVNINALKSVYPAKVSDHKKAEIEIQTIEGKKIKCEIQDIAAANAPDELRLALVPVLYLHQQFVYPPLPAKKFNEN